MPMAPEEHLIIRQYRKSHDRNIIGQFISRNVILSDEFREFSTKVFNDKRGMPTANEPNGKLDRTRRERRVALLVKLSGLPILSTDEPESAFIQMAKVLPHAARTIKRYHDAHKEYVLSIARAVEAFEQDPHQFKQEAWPSLYMYLEERDWLLNEIKNTL